eukprot:5106174-Prymnesium_polylepis.1
MDATMVDSDSGAALPISTSVRSTVVANSRSDAPRSSSPKRRPRGFLFSTTSEDIAWKHNTGNERMTTSKIMSGTLASLEPARLWCGNSLPPSKRDDWLTFRQLIIRL